MKGRGKVSIVVRPPKMILFFLCYCFVLLCVAVQYSTVPSTPVCTRMVAAL